MSAEPTSAAFWRPGDVVVLRSVQQRVGTTRPLRVVEDGPHRTALYLAPGTRCARRSGTRGGPRDRVLVIDDGAYREWIWKDNRVLVLYEAGAAHSVQLFWRDADLAFLGYHIDLQLPWRRSAIGFDTMDLALDLTVAPDGTWEWKDEDELEWRVAHGHLSTEAATLARAEGERAVRRLRSSWQFDPRWRSWHPDPTWTPPELPPGWDRLEP